MKRRGKVARYGADQRSLVRIKSSFFPSVVVPVERKWRRQKPRDQKNRKRCGARGGKRADNRGSSTVERPAVWAERAETVAL